ncbi:MAG: tetratricopeptide repeat protein [Alphaproteobacteria bacterium]
MPNRAAHIFNSNNIDDYGMNLFRAGLYEEAARHWQKTARANQHDPVFYYYRGWCRLFLGEAGDASVDMETACSMFRRFYMEDWQAKAETIFYLTAGDYERSLKNCQQLQSQILQFNQEFSFIAGLNCFYMKDMQQAAHHWQMLLAHIGDKNQPTENNGWINAALINKWVAQALLEIGDAQAADIAATTAISAGFAAASVYLIRAQARKKMQRFEESLHDISLAIEMNSSSPEFFQCRGDLLCDMGRHEEALASFNTAHKLNPENSTILLSRGRCWQHLNFADRALADYSTVIARQENIDQHFKASVWHKRALLYAERGQIEMAIRDFDAAVIHSPHNLELRQDRAIFLLRQGRSMEEAEKDFSYILEKQQHDDPLLYWYRAQCRFALKRIDDANEDMKKASHA